MKYKEVLLGDIADVQWGDTSTTKAKYTNDGYKAFSASGNDGNLPYYDYDREGIVLSAIGAACGRFWYTSGKWSCIKNTIRFWSIDENICLTKYLFYAINPKSWIISGSAQPFITLKSARNYRLRLPDLKTQKKNVRILSALDQKIELNNSVIQSLYNIGRAMFDDYSNDVDNVIIKATDKLLFERGIEPGSNYYSKDKTDTNIRFIRVGDMLSSVPENYVERGLCQNSILKDSDVAMSFDATIGRVSYGISGGFSSGLRKISSKDTHISNAFIYYYLTSNEVQKTLLENATGTTILHAGKSIDHFKLPYNNSAAKKISEKLQSIFEKQLSIKQQNKTLMELRDTILPKLMSGEIDLEGVVV